MKLIDILEYRLYEAGIRTADVDRAARLALLKILPTTVKAIIAQAETRLPPKTKNEYGDYDSSRHYDNLYNYFEKHQAELVDPICDNASSALTIVTKERLISQLKPMKHPYAREKIEDMVVSIEMRESSSDSYKDYGGYYSELNNKVKVFVNREQIKDAAWELVQEEIVGESEGRGYRHMISIIVPVFVHEYAHVEQTLRGKQHLGDLGYITTGIKGRGRKGRRGGYHRDPKTDMRSYLRYKGNVDEIDSFASEAASELMHEVLSQLGGWRTVDVNGTIDSIQQDMSYGYASSRTLSHYGDMLRRAFDGAYADISLNPEQMEKVWKRFAKRVYQKLQDYRDPRAGKSAMASSYDKEWVRLAKSEPMKDAIGGIARMEAERIAKPRKDDWYVRPTEEVVKSILSGYQGDMYKAEMFIGEYYFGWEDSPNKEKTIGIFRRMVAKYYEKLSRS